MYYSPFAYPISFFFFFFFNDTATTEIYTLSLHDALPILAQSHAHDGGHAGLLHRDAVDRVRGLHGAGVVRDDDELRLILEFGEQPHVAAYVRVVERRVHLVEQTERAGFRQEDREQERHGDERALARREQVNPLGALAARSGVDLDLALEGLVLVREPHVALAAAEQRLEHGAKVLAHLAERLEEHGLRRPVDLARRLLQRLAGGHEVVPLGHQELEAL